MIYSYQNKLIDNVQPVGPVQPATGQSWQDVILHYKTAEHCKTERESQYCKCYTVFYHDNHSVVDNIESENAITGYVQGVVQPQHPPTELPGGPPWIQFKSGLDKQRVFYRASLLIIQLDPGPVITLSSTLVSQMMFTFFLYTALTVTSQQNYTWVIITRFNPCQIGEVVQELILDRYQLLLIYHRCEWSQSTRQRINSYYNMLQFITWNTHSINNHGKMFLPSV